MKSLADGLPPEIARQIHRDWRKNEAERPTSEQLAGVYFHIEEPEDLTVQLRSDKNVRPTFSLG